ncbi:hypothetical protein TNCV_3210811 [Trichonephila clavipes]|nr:hypothetical protein TNCV_3210811 [Trichonephila clavipes]
MFRVVKTKLLPGHSCIGSTSVKNHFVLACLPPPRSPTREAVCRSSGKTRHLEYIQNIVLQHQGEDPTGNPPPLTWNTKPTAMCIRGHRREVSPVD